MTTKGNQHKSTDDTLSAILGSTSERGSHGSGHGQGHDLDAADHGDADEFEVEHMAGYDDGDGTSPDDFLGDEVHLDYDAEQRSVYSEIRTRRAARRHELRQRKATGNGRRARLLGGVLLGAGAALHVMAGRGMLGPAWTDLGVDPVMLVALGGIIMVVGLVRRHLAVANNRIDELAYTHQEAQLDVQANLQFLVEHQQHHFERPPAQGEELEHVLMLLQRQDDKINNLSRALKMYGKPLMEIAGQTGEVSAQVGALQKQVEAFAAGSQEAFTGLSDQLAAAGQDVDLTPLQEQTRTVAEELRRSLRELGDRLPDSRGLQQQLVRLEAGVQALTQRQEDGEMRKSLVRIEDFNKLQTKKLDELARSDNLTAEVLKLEKQLDTAVGKLGATVDQIRQRDLSNLESSVKDIQRELAGLATSTAYIHQAVKSGSSGAVRGGRAGGPAPQAAIAATTEAGPAPKPSPGGGMPAARPAADADADGGGYSTGTRASSGKNVLGAIAKLKNMKK